MILAEGRAEMYWWICLFTVWNLCLHIGPLTPDNLCLWFLLYFNFLIHTWWLQDSIPLDLSYEPQIKNYRPLRTNFAVFCENLIFSAFDSKFILILTTQSLPRYIWLQNEADCLRSDWSKIRVLLRSFGIKNPSTKNQLQNFGLVTTISDHTNKLLHRNSFKPLWKTDGERVNDTNLLQKSCL